MVDEPLFKVSPARAVEILKNQQDTGYTGRRFCLTQDAKGWECLQELPPDDWKPERLMGGFSAAWAIVPSGGVPTWQFVGHK